MTGLQLYTSWFRAALHNLLLAEAAAFYHNRGAVLATNQQAQ